MTERALLHFMGDGPDQRVRAERTAAPPARSARRQIGSDQIRHEAPFRFPAQDRANDRVRAQIRQNGKAHLRIRIQVTGVSLDATFARAKADHANQRPTTGRMRTQCAQ